MITEALQSDPGTPINLKLSGDAETYGISLPEGSDLTINYNKKTLDVEPDENGQYAGSAGTKTNGFQLLKDSTVVFKNGTLEADGAKILVQNYSNLTLENMILNGSENNTYVLSNNFGEIHLKGNTKILATGSVNNKENVAFDLWYGMNKNGEYDDGVTVYIDDPTVVIQGPIEFGHASRTTVAQWIANTHLYVCVDYNLDSLRIPDGFVWRIADNGMYELKRSIDVN